MRRPWSASLGLVLALFALVPSKACGCIESYPFSSVRMLLAVQLSLVLLAVSLAAAGTRAKWATVAGLVALLSCVAALLLASIGPMASVAALVLPTFALVVLVWIRRLVHRGTCAGLTSCSSRPPSVAAERQRSP